MKMTLAKHFYPTPIYNSIANIALYTTNYPILHKLHY